MPAAKPVPITPKVLEWTIDESGFTDEAIASALDVSVATIEEWKNGTAKPTLTQFRKLAGKLHRPLATFLLPEPPKKSAAHVEFRDISGRAARKLNPTERRYVRRAHRIQQMLAWIAVELNESLPQLPRYALADSAETAGTEYRERLDVPVGQQQIWVSTSKAFDNWRLSVEAVGVTVFLFSLGEKSCRGFSLWHDIAPIIAINTAWREEARIYTLFHELGHLATRSSSACAEWAGKATRPKDPVERWCERFSASLLLPRAAVQQFISASTRHDSIRELAIASDLANRFKVSLRAATLRLIELGFADWDLYEQIPSSADSKKSGGGGRGRNRLEIREDEFGPRGTGMFVEAVKKDLLSRSQAVEYLDIPDQAFDHLAETAS